MVMGFKARRYENSLKFVFLLTFSSAICYFYAAILTLETMTSRSGLGPGSKSIIDNVAVPNTELNLKLFPDMPSISDDQFPQVTLPGDKIPILIMACNRPTVARCIDSLLRYRRSEKFPIIVSQDCGDEATAEAIRGYSDQVLHIRQPDLSEPETVLSYLSICFFDFSSVVETRTQGIRKLLQDIKTLQVGLRSNVSVEDDMEIAPDFFDYFEAFLPVLKADSSLLCVSAWNDNGKPGLSEDPSSFFKSDFFPGLGWMLRREFWQEIRAKWPKTYWDVRIAPCAKLKSFSDFLGLASKPKPAFRKVWMMEYHRVLSMIFRGCIRPEISRTSNFGRKGVSGGLYFEEHVGKVFLNSIPANFSGFSKETGIFKSSTEMPMNVIQNQESRRLSVDVRKYLKPFYDQAFLYQVYDLSTEISSTTLKDLISSADLILFPGYTNNSNMLKAEGVPFAFEDVNSPFYCGRSCRRRFRITFNRLNLQNPRYSLIPEMKILKEWTLMDDIREDAARTAYKDIVSFKVQLKHPQPLQTTSQDSINVEVADDLPMERYFMVYIAPEKRPQP